MWGVGGGVGGEGCVSPQVWAGQLQQGKLEDGLGDSGAAEEVTLGLVCDASLPGAPGAGLCCGLCSASV